MEKKRLCGSYTVEAAFLCPIIVLLTAFCLHTAISLYQTVNYAAGDTETLRQMDSTEVFLKALKSEEQKDTWEKTEKSCEEKTQESVE